MEATVSTRCFELFPLRVSDVGGHCDPAEAFTSRDMTETTMQISLTASGLSHATCTVINETVAALVERD